MPFPRKPRGEKPATTIKWLRLQLRRAERTIENLKSDIRHRLDENHQQSQTIAGLNAYKDDLEQEVHDIKIVFYKERDIYRDSGRRLNFLEGYYAAKQETLPPHGREIASNKPDIVNRGRPGDTGSISNGEEAREEGGKIFEAWRTAPAPRDEVRRERQYDRQDPQRDTLENFEVGIARDAEPRR